MGLDMSVYKVLDSDVIESFGAYADGEMYMTVLNALKLKGENTFYELFYWRKHNALHGLFADYALEHFGISEDDFNVCYMRIDSELLNKIEKQVLNNELVPRSGFFWGSADMVNVYRDDDLEFVRKAREAIEQGYTLYYHPWW